MVVIVGVIVLVVGGAVAVVSGIVVVECNKFVDAGIVLLLGLTENVEVIAAEVFVILLMVQNLANVL